MGGAVCLLAGVGFLIVLLVGALILRAAVAVVNRVSGPQKPKVQRSELYEDWDWDDEPEDERPRRRGHEPAVPEPGIGKGMMIASTSAVLTALFAVMLTLALETIADGPFDRDEAPFAVLVILTLPFSFAAMTLVLIPMLPTTFTRAGLVAFLYHALGLFLLGIVGGTIALLLRF